LREACQFVAVRCIGSHTFDAFWSATTPTDEPHAITALHEQPCDRRTDWTCSDNHLQRHGANLL